MSISGATLAQDAMFQAGVLGQDGTTQPQGDADVQLVLRRFQRLIDSFSTETQMVYTTATPTIPLTAGVGTYSTSLLPGGRPVQFANAYVSYGGVDYPLEFITQKQYDAIGIKTIAAIPQYMYYIPDVPNGTMYLFPVPSGTTTLTVQCQYPLVTAITPSTVLSFPPGYEKLFVDCLAEDICPSFDRPVTPDIAKAAANARRKIAAINYVALTASTPFDNVGWNDAWAFQCRVW